MLKKEPKTNAMRQLDSAKIPYETPAYDCDGVVCSGRAAEGDDNG